MARRRMIDPHFWESGDVTKLDIFARYIFISMFSHADDMGRGNGGAVYIRNVTFPFEDIPLSKIKRALEAIKTALDVKFYEVNGAEYYQLNNWNKWQRVDKPQPSLLPPYSEIDSDIQSAIHSENDSANDSVLKEKKGKEDKIREDNAPARASLFPLFWQAYPKKKSKEAAEKAFNKLKPDQALLDLMLKAIEAQKKTEDWKKQNGQFIPYPATWLNGKRWQDETGTTAPSEPKQDWERLPWKNIGLDPLAPREASYLLSNRRAIYKEFYAKHGIDIETRR